MVHQLQGLRVEYDSSYLQTMEQKNGFITSKRLNPSPPFYLTFIDLFGQMQIRDTVKKRVKVNQMVLFLIVVHLVGYT